MLDVITPISVENPEELRNSATSERNASP